MLGENLMEGSSYGSMLLGHSSQEEGKEVGEILGS